jgi:hypothetical protein
MGDIKIDFVILILPGRERLKRFQNSTFFLMVSRITVKFWSQSAGSFDRSIPRIRILSEKVNPRSRISSEIGTVLPIWTIAVFSRLHFSPLKTEKSINISFKARSERLCRPQILRLCPSPYRIHS